MNSEKLNKTIAQFLFCIILFYGVSKVVEVVIAIKESKLNKEALKLEIEHNELKIEQLKRQKQWKTN